MLFQRVKRLLSPNFEPPRGKGAFTRAIPVNGRVLDVGCGNNSPEWFKTVRPDIYYVGLDVGDYRQDSDPTKFADEYVITDPDSFPTQIDRFLGQMDAVVSCHNLEHCNDPQAALTAMANALRPGGRLYLSFPCEESTTFPHRGGCLNFFDDSSHKQVPSWGNVLIQLERAGCQIVFSCKRYRPFPLALKGLLLEPLSAFRREVIPDGSTWALYGFESVIWATIPPSDVRVFDWGPKESEQGRRVNLQPDGTSAMWIQVSGLERFGETWVYFGDQRPQGPAVVTDSLLTTAIPNAIISRSGEYDVTIREPSGRTTTVGVLVIRQS